MLPLAALLDSPLVAWLLLGLSGLFLLAAVGAVVWQRLPAARGWLLPAHRLRERHIADAEAHLDRGDWQAARVALQRVRESGPLEEGGQRRLARLEGACQHIACEQALRAGQYPEAMAHYQAAADLLGLGPAEATRRIVEVMLAEIRRLIADQPTSDRVPELIAEIRHVQPKCAEALFWEGIARIHRGSPDAAVASLQMALDAAPTPMAEVPLYLGALLAVQGKRREALKRLSQAGKIAPFCPVVSWQLGMMLLEAGGDQTLAIKTLQKAVEPAGLPRFKAEPQKIWTQTLPPDSWLANLARRAQWRCPLGLDEVAEAVLSGQLALAQAYERAGQPGEAAPLFAEVLKVADSLVARKGLGLALARLDMHAEALPHLRYAYAHEQPQSPMTTGYLALSLARGGNKSQRAANIADGLKLVGSLGGKGYSEAPRLARELYAEARAAGVPIGEAELVELANVFVADGATDAAAAAVYEQLASEHPQAVTLDHAQLYVRAAQVHGVSGAADEFLFDRAFRDRDDTTRRFDASEWSFDAAERLYLERWADRHPGKLPTAPGPAYGKQVLMQLLMESKQFQATGQLDEAGRAAELAGKLGPNQPATLDRRAELAYRRGDATAAIEWLQRWAELHPRDPRPLARQALIEHQYGRYDSALALVQQAIPLAGSDEDRARLSLHAARIALSVGRTKVALPYLEECLRLQPQHPQALACVAAMQWQYGNFSALPALSRQLGQVQAEDPRFHYLAAACQYTTGRYAEALEAAKYAATSPDSAGDALHLQALAHLALQQRPEAWEAVKQASERDGPAREHAWALRGLLAWQDGDFEQAYRAWSAVDPARRESWGVAPLLPTVAFLAGVQLAKQERYAHAGEWLRLAAEGGFDHPLLEPARGHVLIQAGVKAATEGRGNDAAQQQAAAQLEAAFALGEHTPAVAAWLARLRRQRGKLAEAAAALATDESDENFDVLMQRGLLAVAERQLPLAERSFAAAAEKNPFNVAAAVNLLHTRFSLGQLEAASKQVPGVLDLLAKGPLKRTLTLLKQVWIDPPSRAAFAGINSDDEGKLLAWVQSLGRLDSVAPLVRQLAIARSKSAPLQSALLEVQVLEGLEQLDRGDAVAARRILERVARDLDKPSLRNLVGCSRCLTQDFAAAVKAFQAALPAVGDDPLVQQNLALARAWEGDAERAAAHWKRYLDALPTLPAPPDVGDYPRRLATAVRGQMAGLGVAQ